jgi:hypothetical protein
LGRSLVTPILVAHEPEYGAQREDGTRKSEQMLGIGCRQIDDHQLAHDGEQCDQDNSANLYDAVSSLRDNKQ